MSRISRSPLPPELLERRDLLAVTTYSFGFDGAGLLDLFGAHGGGDLQQFHVNSPIPPEGGVDTSNLLGANNRPPVVGEDFYLLASGQDQSLVSVASPGVLDNDHDPEGGAVSVISYDSESQRGALIRVYPHGGFIYDPRDSEEIQSLQSGETLIDTFQFVVGDAVGRTALSEAVVQVTGSNNPPELIASLPVAVTEGGETILDGSLLTVDDPDDSGGGLSYSVTSPPLFGRLERIDLPGVAALSFSESDLIHERLRYVHNGGEQLFDSLEFLLRDGGEDGADPVGGVLNFAVAAVNDLPENTGSLPSRFSGVEDTPLSLDLRTIELADAEGGLLTLTLSTTAGTLSADPHSGVAISGNGSGTVVLTGVVDALNAYLAQWGIVEYLPPSDLSGVGVDAIDFLLSDGAGSVPLGTVAIDLDARNDDPSFDGALSVSATLLEDEPTGVDLGSISLVDADSDLLTLRLEVSHGLLSIDAPVGVAVSGSGTSVATLQGTVDLLNSFLSQAIHAVYTGPLHAAGDAYDQITVSVSDGHGTQAIGQIAVNIVPQNDGPLIVGSLSASLSEGGQTTITPAVLAAVDPDDSPDGLTYVVTSAPADGSLELTSSPGIAIASFTQADVDANQLIYRHGGGETTLDAFTVEVADGGEHGAGASAATVSIDISGVNDDPTNEGSLPTSLAAVEETASTLDLSLIDLADVDAGAGDLTVAVSVDQGTLLAADALGVTVAGSGSDALSLTGSLTALNDYLNVATSVSYVGPLDLVGGDAATLSLSVNDGGNTGVGGGTSVALGAVGIDISGVNDDPTNEGSLPASLAAIEETASTLDLSLIDLADVDAGTGDLTVALSVDQGTLLAADALGVTVAGSGSDALSLVGTLTALNDYLNIATSVSYVGPLDLTGADAATLSLSVNDGGNTGTGGGTSVALGAVGIDISGVNDDPTNEGSLPASLAAIEETASTLDLSLIDLADVDAGTGDLTVAVSVDQGTLLAADALGVTVAGSGSDALSLTGSLTALNDYLNVATSVSYVGPLDLTGADAATLTVAVNDGGNTGAGGGTNVTLGTVSIDISGINDDPVNIGSLPSDLDVVAGLLSGLDLSLIEIADVDAGNGLLSVELSAGLSTLSASSGGGVVATGSGTETLTLTGVVTDLNAYLDGGVTISLLPGVGLLGENQDLLSVVVNDGENTGVGGGSDVALGSINIDVVPAIPLAAAATSMSVETPDAERQEYENTVDAAFAVFEASEPLLPTHLLTSG